MATQVYQLKEGVELSALEEYGFVSYENYAIKVVVQDLESEPVKFLLKRYYTNPEWIEKIYKPNKKIFKKEYGLQYTKKGQIKYTEEFTNMLTTWFIQIDLSDSPMLGFTSGDKRDTLTYYGKGLIDKYCPQDAIILMNSGLVEVIEVEN